MHIDFTSMHAVKLRKIIFKFCKAIAIKKSVIFAINIEMTVVT